ncbi:hypothetical protein ACJX0J_032520, partial [Zea mays]
IFPTFKKTHIQEMAVNSMNYIYKPEICFFFYPLYYGAVLAIKLSFSNTTESLEMALITLLGTNYHLNSIFYFADFNCYTLLVLLEAGWFWINKCFYNSSKRKNIRTETHYAISIQCLRASNIIAVAHNEGKQKLHFSSSYTIPLTKSHYIIFACISVISLATFRIILYTFPQFVFFFFVCLYLVE